MLNAFEGIRLVTLDLDDTLWAIEPVIRRAEHKLHDWLCDNAPAAAASYSPQDLRDLRVEAERLHPELVNDITTLRRRSIAIALERSEEDPALESSAFEVFWAARNEVELYAEVESALAWLQEHYTVAALSNGNADINSMPLGKYFDFSLSARQAGVMKPEAEIFRMACAEAACPVNAVLHAGDDILCDVLGAHRAGLHAAWINRHDKDWDHHEPAPADRYWQAADLDELTGLLGRESSLPEKIGSEKIWPEKNLPEQKQGNG